MNPVVFVHFVAAVVTVVVSVPLIQRRVKMNRWYGVRIPAAFASEAAWFDINHYGGRLLLGWGLAIAATAGVGTFLDRSHWLTYDWASLVIIVGGLVWVMTKIHQHAQSRSKAG